MACQSKREIFYGQFSLTPKHWPYPAHWKRLEINNKILSYCPSLSIHTLTFETLDHEAILLGYPLFIGQHTIFNDSDTDIGEPRSLSAFLELVYKHVAGRFLLIIKKGEKLFIYLDGAGSLALVYSPQMDLVASTPSLLLSDDPNHSLFKKTLSDYPNGDFEWFYPAGQEPDDPEWFYPAGLTPADGVSRLLPNHFLELPSYTVTRHELVTSLHLPARSANVGTVAETIAVDLKASLREIVEQNAPIYMCLTAGIDTRILLACLQELKEAVTFVTFDYTQHNKHRGHRIDAETSSVIARKFGLNHKIITIRDHIPEHVEYIYQHQSGYASGKYKARDFFFACEENLNLSGCWISGFGGEIARGGRWRREYAHTAKQVCAEELCARIGLPCRTENLRSLQAWLDDLGSVEPPILSDLAYMEHRVGCLKSPRLYGAARFRRTFSPFLSANFIKSSHSVSVDDRIRQELTRSIIRSMWPELLDLPVNDHWRFRDRLSERLKRKMQRLAKDLQIN